MRRTRITHQQNVKHINILVFFSFLSAQFALASTARRRPIHCSIPVFSTNLHACRSLLHSRWSHRRPVHHVTVQRERPLHGMHEQLRADAASTFERVDEHNVHSDLATARMWRSISALRTRQLYSIGEG